MSALVRLAITLGDPAGIGPEVTQKALSQLLSQGVAAAITLVGPEGIADRMAAHLGSACTALTQATFAGPLGRPTAASGRSAIDALEAAILLAQKGQVDALVTAPISKQALAACGCAARGHTEILGQRLGLGPIAMSFFTPALRVVLATTHIALREVPLALTPERLQEVARLLHQALVRRLAVSLPRLALCGLNPHAGEAGLFGDEETRILQPALEQLRREGLSITGPWPADTLFRRAVQGEFHGVVALYHDQALIPVKLLAFGEAVNVTLGLSVPRTSPDHGTAFDLVGTDSARPEGMFNAITTALQLAQPP